MLPILERLHVGDQKNQIKDYPVTAEDADVVLNIWGKNIVALKGKTTRSKPNTVVDLLCNPALIAETFKSRSSMQLKSNSETIVGTHKEKMAGYHKNIWFSKRAITNIIALSKIIQKYRVTYDNEDKMFIFQL